jgi:Family of unknown function (DUF5678)
MDVKKNLEKEFKYFLAHQEELVNKYSGKYIVIKDESVIGDYDSEMDAYFETKKKYELGTFIIQKCSPGTESYTQTYHSRVIFV